MKRMGFILFALAFTSCASSRKYEIDYYLPKHLLKVDYMYTITDVEVVLNGKSHILDQLSKVTIEHPIILSTVLVSDDSLKCKVSSKSFEGNSSSKSNVQFNLTEDGRLMSLNSDKSKEKLAISKNIGNILTIAANLSSLVNPASLIGGAASTSISLVQDLKKVNNLAKKNLELQGFHSENPAIKQLENQDKILQSVLENMAYAAELDTIIKRLNKEYAKFTVVTDSSKMKIYERKINHLQSQLALHRLTNDLRYKKRHQSFTEVHNIDINTKNIKIKKPWNALGVDSTVTIPNVDVVLGNKDKTNELIIKKIPIDSISKKTEYLFYLKPKYVDFTVSIDTREQGTEKLLIAQAGELSSVQLKKTRTGFGYKQSLTISNETGQMISYQSSSEKDNDESTNGDLKPVGNQNIIDDLGGNINDLVNLPLEVIDGLLKSTKVSLPEIQVLQQVRDIKLSQLNSLPNLKDPLVPRIPVNSNEDINRLILENDLLKRKN